MSSGVPTRAVKPKATRTSLAKTNLRMLFLPCVFCRADQWRPSMAAGFHALHVHTGHVHAFHVHVLHWRFTRLARALGLPVARRTGIDLRGHRSRRVLMPARIAIIVL